jgi:hypothetical protein
VGNDSINMIDPRGLWGIGFGTVNGGNFNIGVGDPSILFTPDSLNDLGQSAAATADGINPFGDPFANNGFYDPCDSSSKASHFLGATGRNLLLAAAIPNIGTWAQNPAMYELGSTTMPAADFEALSGLSPIARGQAMWQSQGMGALLNSFRAGASDYAATIPQGGNSRCDAWAFGFRTSSQQLCERRLWGPLS